MVIGGSEVPGPLWGFDASKFNPVADDPEDADFCIARLCYHRAPDTTAEARVAQARKRGQRVARYAFPILDRPSTEIEAQLELIKRRCDETDIRDGDGPVYLDVEAYPVSNARDSLGEPLDFDPRQRPELTGALPRAPGLQRWVQPTPAWCDGLDQLVEGLTREYGLVGWYHSQTVWSLLGKPDQFRDLAQWAAHWRTSAGSPASAYGRVDLHQYRVGPWSPGDLHVIGQHDDPGAIDHDVCRGEWPALGRVSTLPPPPPVPTEPDTLSALAEAVARIEARQEAQAALLAEVRALLQDRGSCEVRCHETRRALSLALRAAGAAVLPEDAVSGNGSLRP